MYCDSTILYFLQDAKRRAAEAEADDESSSDDEKFAADLDIAFDRSLRAVDVARSHAVSRNTVQVMVFHIISHMS